MTQASRSSALTEAEASFNAGDYEQTKTLCRTALAQNADQPAILHMLGIVELRSGNPAGACACFKQAQALEPNDPRIWNNLGAAHEALAQPESAEQSYRHAIQLKENFADAHTNLGYLLITLDRLDEGGAHCQRAVSLKPNGRATNFNFAFWLFCQQQYTLALQHAKKAMELSQKHAPTWYLLGQIWRELGQVENASTAYLRALELDPTQSDAALHYAMSQLGQEHYAIGWHYYFQRRRGVDPADTLAPIRPGTPLTGKRVLLTGDQGIGDQLFFLRFAPALTRQGAQLSCRPDPKLAPLLRRLPWIESVLEPEQPFEGDCTFATGDLPLLLRMQSRADIPPPIPLAPRPELKAQFVHRLAELGPPPYLAVTWRAGKMRKSAMNHFLYKSVPPAALGRGLSRLKGTIIVVQRQPLQQELAEFANALGRSAHDFSQLNNDLESMLALMSCVDYYIAVSNTNVHLRASLGLPSHALVAHPPEWRWLWTGARSPWYPGTQIYRQQAEGDWENALGRLCADLLSVPVY